MKVISSEQYDLLKGMGESLEMNLSIFAKLSKAKEDDRSRELQFGTIASKILQACSIGKENSSIHISTLKEAK